jgi:hypothetical protein
MNWSYSKFKVKSFGFPASPWRHGDIFGFWRRRGAVATFLVPGVGVAPWRHSWFLVSDSGTKIPLGAGGRFWFQVSDSPFGL